MVRQLPPPSSSLALSVSVSRVALLTLHLFHFFALYVQADLDALPKPEEIDCEFSDLYRHDEEQAYLTLMSQDIKSINFPCEENYTVRLCKELVALHNPDTHPLGSFELVASNRIRSDEETLGEIFNGQPYYAEKEVADDPEFDWVPRKEQVFSDKQLMQMSVWKKDIDEATGEYEAVDIGCSEYGRDQTRAWKKLGYLKPDGKLKSEQQLIEEGLVTDTQIVADFYKKVETIKTLREVYCFKKAHAEECANDPELTDKDDIEAALAWMAKHKVDDYNEAKEIQKKKEGGLEWKVIEKEEEDYPSDYDDY